MRQVRDLHRVRPGVLPPELEPEHRRRPRRIDRGLDQHRAVLRNNIEKDMLHRAINQDSAIVDFYKFEQDYVVSVVKTVVAGNRKIGALMLTLDSAWLEEQLADLQNSLASSGKIELRYRLGRASSEPMVGSAAEAGAIIAEAGLNLNPSVLVRYSLSERLSLGGAALGLLAASLALSFAAGVVAMTMQRKQMAVKIEEDAALLKRYLGEAFENGLSIFSCNTNR